MNPGKDIYTGTFLIYLFEILVLCFQLFYILYIFFLDIFFGEFNNSTD